MENTGRVPKVDGKVYPKRQTNSNGWTRTPEYLLIGSLDILAGSLAKQKAITEIYRRDSHPQNCFSNYNGIKFVTGR